MLDFKELPQDGVAFEQLVRELLLLAELRAEWTGKGRDQGRDLLAEEIAEGPLGPHKRLWLVQCKHLAHSGRAVGRKDIQTVVDDCHQISADGYLLACSTHPSSSVVQKLNALESNPRNRLVTTIWDSVDLEKRLRQPHGFALAHLFFPQSVKESHWRIYNMGTPSSWAAHYKDFYLILGSRLASMFPPLEMIEPVMERLRQVKFSSRGECVRPRRALYDDKNGVIIVHLDYLVPEKRQPTYTRNGIMRILPSEANCPFEANGLGCIQITWDIRLISYSSFSDHFSIDHSDYYEEFLPQFPARRRGQTDEAPIRVLARWLN